MNTKQLFEEGDLNKRATVLWEYGELITTIEYYNQLVQLYLIDSFYVELYYSPYLNTIEKIEGCDHAAQKKFSKNVEI
jgi:hypothetical protein